MRRCIRDQELLSIAISELGRLWLAGLGHVGTGAGKGWADEGGSMFLQLVGMLINCGQN